MNSHLDEEAVDHFKQYLRIRSVHPNCDYPGCVKLLRDRAASIGLECSVVEVAPSKPVVVMTWAGRDPELPSLMLSSHMDVVPVYADKWDHEPFSAHEDEQGNIYARGAQDMKCVGIQYMEAIHRLMLKNHKPRRSVHLCFTPDEEIGSFEGAKCFVETSEFKKLNVGCVLDESIPSGDESFYLFYGERTTYAFEIHCSGSTGHGSLLLDNTVGEKLSYIMARINDKRNEEKKKLQDGRLSLGDVTTINLTRINGGVQNNVLPSELKMVFDCRLSADTTPEVFQKWINEVCEEAGDGISVRYFYEDSHTEVTKLNKENPWWTSLKTVFDDMGAKLKPIICPGATDSRFYRKLGIPAFGISPMCFTVIKMHDHNEYLNRKVFLNGIDIYCKLITSLADL